MGIHNLLNLYYIHKGYLERHILISFVGQLHRTGTLLPQFNFLQQLPKTPIKKN